VRLDNEPWKKIDGLYFYPWVGDRYHEGSIFGIKILALGESTYFNEEDGKDVFDSQREGIEGGWFAHYNVFAYRQGKWTGRFFTMLIHGLLGRPAAAGERRRVLDSIAFWNYADGEPLESHSRWPRGDDLCRANGKLRRVIEELRPHLVILLSARLWPNLWDGKDFFEPPTADGVPPIRTVCRANGNGVETHLLGVCHPRGFRDEDRGAIAKAIRDAGGKQPGIEAGQDPPVPGRIKSLYAPHLIRVYKRHHAWVFDDCTFGVESRTFAHGATQMVDKLAEKGGLGDGPLTILLSPRPFEAMTGAVLKLMDRPERPCGAWYQMDMGGSSFKACICRDLERYFGRWPEEFYCGIG